MTETETTPRAVVTGASSGIGFVLAKVCADNGFDVLVNAEDGDLDAAAEQLRTTGAQVQQVQADVSRYDGVEQLYAAIALAGRPVSAAALNAGVGQGGAFIDTNFFHRAGMEDTHVGHAQNDDPAQVAKQGFDALMSGEGKIIAGSATTKVQGIASKVLPDKLKAAVHRQMAERGSGD